MRLYYNNTFKIVGIQRKENVPIRQYHIIERLTERLSWSALYRRVE